MFSTAATLAQTAPGDPSPIVPGFDNLGAALFLGAGTWNLLDYTPFFHFAGGVFESDVPVALRYSPLDTYFEFTKALKPYFPTEVFRDRYATQCGEADVPWDDHLSEITVPIFAIGAGERGSGSSASTARTRPGARTSRRFSWIWTPTGRWTSATST